MELTPEQLQQAETMSLDDLRALALAADTGALILVDTTAAVTDPPAQTRDAQGRFTSTDEVDNSADGAVTEQEQNNGEPTATIYRKEIPNGEGSIDVYEADSLEALVDKIAEGKLNANKKIHEFIAEKRAAAAQDTQISQDDEFVIQQKLKDNPKATIKQVVSEVIEERLALEQRSKAAQSQFVNTHPDYEPSEENGQRLVAWCQLHGHKEFTVEGLEKAYQDLTRSGLLKLKAEGASGAAAVTPTGSESTVQPEASATQTRSQRKGSGVSTRSSSRTTVPNTQPTEDEAYKMPIEKLRELANRHMAEVNRQE